MDRKGEKKKLGFTRPAERLSGGQWEEIDTEEMENGPVFFSV